VSHCGQRFESVASALQWHVYAVDVKPSGITYYIDGKMVAVAPSVPGDDDPLFFLVNLAMGGGWPIDLSPVGGSAAVYVDWVRVYT
jgi:beta-glucanase (GH16 family)